MTGDFSIAAAAVTLLLVVFCLGGCAGVYMAWSMEERFNRWAAKVAAAQRAYNELEEKADAGRVVDRGRGGHAVGVATTSQEHALGAQRGPSGVLPSSGGAVVHPAS
jgi:hypothetical protein